MMSELLEAFLSIHDSSDADGTLHNKPNSIHENRTMLYRQKTSGTCSIHQTAAKSATWRLTFNKQVPDQRNNKHETCGNKSKAEL